MNLLTRGQGQHAYADMIIFRGSELPEAAIKALTTDKPFGTERGPFDYSNEWVEAYHEKGSKPEEAKRWILIMNNGSDYKHGAHSIVWYNIDNPTYGNVGTKCYWSFKSLLTNVNQLLRKGEINRCKNYQT